GWCDPPLKGRSSTAAAVSTPGSARIRARAWFQKLISSVADLYLVRGIGREKVSTLRASNPGFVLRRFHRLRIISPAPASRTSDNATSQTTSTDRVRFPPESPARPSPCFKVSFTFALLSFHDGTITATIPVTSEIASVK